MPSFTDLGLPQGALDALDKLGFEKPTPVQAAAIPVALGGRDIIAAASTGTGKTAAFLLPLMGALPKDRSAGRKPRVLVVTPTRELAQQIAGTAMTIGRTCGHFVTTLYGGTKYQRQIRELRGGCDVIIATPGRLCDLIERKAADLSGVQALVLDEADRMLDMGFLPDVTRIVEKLPEQRQTLLFSATIDDSIRRNLGGLLHDAETIQIAQKGQTADKVDHFIMPIKQKGKPELLLSVLEELGGERVIVFARTKARAEDVAGALEDAGVRVTCIHSDKSQAERRCALTAFRKGKAQVIVATDVLARGIDVPSVDYVVNYDLPDMAEDYIHRIGRTGRAGQAGLAISFVSQNSMKALASIERLLGREIPVRQLAGCDADMDLLRSRREKQRLSHSDKRAADFGRVRAERRKKAKQPQADYNYEGWGDKRAKGKGKGHGKKKAADAAEKRTSKRASTGKRDGASKPAKKGAPARKKAATTAKPQRKRDAATAGRKRDARPKGRTGTGKRASNAGGRGSRR